MPKFYCGGRTVTVTMTAPTKLVRSLDELGIPRSTAFKRGIESVIRSERRKRMLEQQEAIV